MCKLASKIVTVLQFTRAIRKIKEDKAKLRLYLDISLLYITCISFIIIISIIKIITTIIASSLTLEFENAFKRMQYVPEYNHAYFLFLFQVPRTIPRTAPAQPTHIPLIQCCHLLARCQTLVLSLVQCF